MNEKKRHNDANLQHGTPTFQEDGDDDYDESQFYSDDEGNDDDNNHGDDESVEERAEENDEGVEEAQKFEGDVAESTGEDNVQSNGAMHLEAEDTVAAIANDKMTELRELAIASITHTATALSDHIEQDQNNDDDDDDEYGDDDFEEVLEDSFI